MAQTLEKIFLQKVAQMPQEEQEVVITVAKNSHKKGASRAAGKHGAGRQGEGVGRGRAGPVLPQPCSAAVSSKWWSWAAPGLAWLTRAAPASLLLALLAAATAAAQQVPAISSVSHAQLFSTSTDIPTTINVNVPHPSVITVPLLKPPHSTAAAQPVLALPAPAQQVAKVSSY